jgi:hypothetical protein
VGTTFEVKPPGMPAVETEPAPAARAP